MTEPVTLASPPSVALSPATDSRSSRIKGIDALRGIAAASVVLYHYTSNYQRVFGHAKPPLFYLSHGALGVVLFFLISGFVIFMTLERTRRPIDFVRSRFSRLFPAYWAAMCLTFVVLHILPIPGRTATVSRLLANTTMVQGLFGIGSIDTVYWTLQVELCFYTIMFLLFWVGQLRNVEFYLLGLMLLNIARSRLLPPGSPWLAHHALQAKIIDKVGEVLILNYAYAFLIGIMIYRFSQQRQWRYPLVIALCLLYAAQDGPWLNLIATIVFTVLIGGVALGRFRFLEFPPLLYLGFISYSLYLTHQHIGYAILRRLEASRLNVNIAIVLTVGVAMLIADLLTRTIEQPALRLLRRKHAPASQ